MKDLFSDLLRRSRGDDLPSPVVPSRFEHAPVPGDVWGEVEEVVPVRRDPRRPAPTVDLPRPDRSPLRQTGAADQAARTSPSDEDAAEDPRGVPVEPAVSRAAARPGPVVQPVPSIDLAAIIAEALRHRDPANDDDDRRGDRAPVPNRTVANDADRTPLMAASASTGRAEPVAPIGPAAAAEPERRASPPAVEVRIGRIEISATPPPAPRPAPPSRATRPATVALSLREYLARRQRS